MADSPEMVVSDPDAPTEQSVRQALANLPTWEEWLQQHEFRHEPATKYDAECYRRHWSQHGRGWKILVRIYPNVLQVFTFNNPFRYGKPFAFAEVAERSIPGVVGNLIAEIERDVSDATKKRRIMAYINGVERQKREDRVMMETTLPFWVVEAEEDLDDPGKMSKRQLDRILNRVQTGCYVKGQRVRVKPVTHGGTRLVGKEGAVVSANDNSCYVALDDFVAAGDPDPFRFMQDEVEPIFENQEQQNNLDAPEPYLKALDYMTPLAKIGYTPHYGTGVYRKQYGGLPALGDRFMGCLTVRVQPQSGAVAAMFFIDYQRDGEASSIADILVPALDVLEIATRIEQLATSEKVTGISEFAAALHSDPLIAKQGMVLKAPPDHLLHVFGEAQENADDPQSYLDELVRRSGFVDVFRRNGMRLQRPPGAGRPYYSLFWIPNAVTEVSYDIYLEPMPNGDWEVSAEGLKMFTVGDREISEPFDINWTMTVPAAMPPEDALENIKVNLLRFTGPTEPTPLERDWDDVDESADEEIDFAQYAKDSASYNPVQLLTVADIRRCIREAGFRVKSFYRSNRTSGFTINVVPVKSEDVDLFEVAPWEVAVKISQAVRDAIVFRLPTLGDFQQEIHRGSFKNDKLEITVWPDVHGEGATNSITLDIRPTDHMRRMRGGGLRQEGVDDPPEDITRHVIDSADAVKVIEQSGYTYGTDRRGMQRWNKYWKLPQPLQSKSKCSPTWDVVWGSPDPWGHYVWGIQSQDYANAIQSGFIVVRPVQAPAHPEGWDYATSVRRVLLKVEQVMTTLPETGDIDVMRKHLYQVMERIRVEVNAEADKTLIPEGVDDPGSYVDRLTKAQYCPRCLSHDTECIGPHSALSGGYGNGMPQEFWQCNACGDKFLWSDDRSVGFKLESVDPDDPEAFLQRARTAKMGEVVNIICPKCGSRHQSFKNWPDNAPKEWGFSCPKCAAHIPLVNVVVEAVAVPPPVRLSEAFPEVQDDPSDDPTQYVKTTFDPEQFLLAAGWKHEPDQNYAYYTKTFPMPHYQLGGMTFTGVQVRVGFWDQVFGTTAVTARLVDDKDSGLGVNGWQLSKQELYPWADEDGAAPDTNFDKTMPVRRFAMGIGGVLAGITWPESRFAAQHASSLVNTEIGKFVKNLNAQAAKPLHNESNYVGENAEDVDKPERYIQQLGTVEHVALIHGMTKLYTSDTEGGWMRTIKLRHPIEIRATDYLSHLGMNAIRELRLVVRYERKPNTLFPKQQKHALTVFVRVPYVGENSGSKLSHILWRTGAEFTQESSAAHALNQVLTYAQQSLDDSHEALNLQRTKEILNMGVSPFMADVNESADVDSPESLLPHLPPQTFVTFTRRFEEDQEYAEANFPGERLEQALGKQLLREIAEANVFDMATIRVAGFERVDDDVYKVRLAFSGDYGSDEALRDLIQSIYREGVVAGEFNIEQYRPVPVKARQVRCRHCGRPIRQENGVWVDPAATGDDSTWRETCDAHDTFTAEHEPDDPARSSGPQTEAFDPDDPTTGLARLLPSQATYAPSTLSRLGFQQTPEAPSQWKRVADGVSLTASNANNFWQFDASIWDGERWVRHIWNWRWHPESEKSLPDFVDEIMARIEADCPRDVAEALDPDDPTDILQSQPGFEFRHTSNMGDMVFVKGPGEDTSDWPRDIGRIILGPSPNPDVNPEQRWYVVGVRGVPDERLSEFGFGMGLLAFPHPKFKLRTFDTKEDAALAIWLVRSRMPEKTGVLGKTRRLPPA